jgi:signal transduction histidine kinase/DNA-binding NarL/FixJ family response regulator
MTRSILAIMSVSLALSVAILATLVARLWRAQRRLRDGERLADAAVRLARGEVDTQVPAAPPPLARLAMALQAMARSLQERDREAEALLAVAQVAPIHDLDALLAAVRVAIAPVVDARVLAMVAVDGEAVVGLANSSGLAPGPVSYPRAASAAEAALVRGEAIVRTPAAHGPCPEDALARLVGAAAYAVVPLRGAGGGGDAALIVDVAAPGLTSEQLRFVATLGHKLAARTEGMRLNAELAERNRALEQALRAKSDFLTMMSHELRTPLNAILGFAEVFLGGDAGALSPSQQRYARNIQDGGRHLLRLINDLLDLSKIEAGRLEVVRESCPPRQLIDETLATLQPLAAGKDVTLVAPTSTAPAPNVIADELRLRQVLINLLFNAVKFTPPGRRAGIELTPSVDGRTLRLTVWDEGAGIAIGDVDRLFRPFEQLANARSQAEPGSGLGLALTKQLVELMGGRVSVDGGLGRGARFSIDLPSGAPPLSASARQRLPGPRQALIVDDDAVARELLELGLSAHGFRCHAVADGAAALAQARTLQPSLIVLDVFLRGADGWELLRSLRADPRTTGIPVVMATVSADRRTSFDLGAVDHLVKPVSADALAQALVRAGLGEPQSTRSTAPAVSTQSTANGSTGSTRASGSTVSTDTPAPAAGSS